MFPLQIFRVPKYETTEDGSFVLSDGSVKISKSTFHAEFLRLREQCFYLGLPASDEWLDRKCKKLIKTSYGHRCWRCNCRFDILGIPMLVPERALSFLPRCM